MNVRSLLLTSVCASAILLAAFAPPAPAQVVVSPGALASTEGNSNNGFPFNLTPFAIPSQRYQQVYNASEFSALSGPELITQIAFRPDATTGNAFSATLPYVQIDLSTTSAAADGLSATFANNVGADDTTVHSGALALSSSFTGPANGPKDFDIIITLTTPFLYNPALGNLLMDVRNFGAGMTSQFDSVPFPSTVPNGDGTSRVTKNDVTSGTGNPDTSGLVTQFTFTPRSTSVPEPGTLAYISVLAVPAGLLLRRLRRSA